MSDMFKSGCSRECGSSKVKPSEALPEIQDIPIFPFPEVDLIPSDPHHPKSLGAGFLPTESEVAGFPSTMTIEDRSYVSFQEGNMG